MNTSRVFSGISLTYNEIIGQDYTPAADSDYGSNTFVIEHCREGRLEYIHDGSFYYMSQGDVAVHRAYSTDCGYNIPAGKYSGITISIDVDKAPGCLSCFLDDVNVEPAVLMDRFASCDEPCIIRENSSLGHIFSELYSIPDEIRKGYLKIKVLEILLFISTLSPDREHVNRKATASQVTLANEISRFLTAHMDEKITIDNLSDRFHVSKTQLKSCFKGVYGDTIYSYIRKQRMESAAQLLRNSDKTVLEIANLHGYDNGSKFSAAFRDTMGMTPKEYRQS